MKAAVYGRGFLNKDKIDPEVIHSVLKLLKIKVSLSDDFGMAITYNQILDMGIKKIVQLMLNLKAHYIAIETARTLKLPSDLISHIFTDWATYAIDRYQGTQESLATKIYDMFNKLLSEASIKSFTIDMKVNDIALTEIAHEAAKKGKKDLAMKLLENETSIKRKVPVLVWMKEHESSLEQAFYGKDTNVIILVLIKFFENCTDEERKSVYQRVLNLPSELGYHLISFLKRTGRRQDLSEFLQLKNGSQFYYSESQLAASIPIRCLPESNEHTAGEFLKVRMGELKRFKQLTDAMKDKETSLLTENEMKVVDYHLKDPKSASEKASKYKVDTVD